MSTSRAPAGQRVAAATAAMLGGAVLAHAAGGGGFPSPAVWALLTGLLAMAGAVVVRVGPRRWPALAVVGASQYVAHQLLAVTSHRSLPADAGGAACAAGHGHGLSHGAPSCADATAAGAVDGAVGTAGWVDTRMVLLHLAATLCVGLLLAQGDRALAAVLTVLRPLWRRRAVTVHPVPLVRGARVVVDRGPEVVPPALVCVGRRPRRGPPGPARAAGLLPA